MEIETAPAFCARHIVPMRLAKEEKRCSDGSLNGEAEYPSGSIGKEGHMPQDAGRTGKIVAAFFLSVLFFLLFMFIGELSTYHLGEGVGFVLTFVVMAAYFFVCQFRLSRGNADALRKDWPIMLALNAVPLVTVIIMAFSEKWPVVLVQGLIMLVAGWGGAFAGAAMAARAARDSQKAQ